MAHGIAAGPILQIHQALHGYSRGHQRLSGSSQVRPRDAKTMLVLSDISGPGVRPGDDGYLTGYPLSESGLYVLARTWAAPEMPRPGCVWTHSLLIDFADLAALVDPAALLELFRRPEADDFLRYGEALALETGQVSRKVGATVESPRRLASGLYGKARNHIVAARPQDAHCDQVVMALWAQQWPRLRRAFKSAPSPAPSGRPMEVSTCSCWATSAPLVPGSRMQSMSAVSYRPGSLVGRRDW